MSRANRKLKSVNLTGNAHPAPVVPRRQQDPPERNGDYILSVISVPAIRTERSAGRLSEETDEGWHNESEDRGDDAGAAQASRAMFFYDSCRKSDEAKDVLTM